MATQPASTSPQGTHQVAAARALLAWRILIGVSAFGSAWTLLGNGVRVFRGEAVRPGAVHLGVVLL
ncbi:MAG: hypothetical protein U5J83_15680 [Bryobacterales bacterium]|nr:hypothetical protein [Bryobacterales bacterium]